ncbi:MAG TPA: amidohydrolase [Candidatus Mediterraneibacter pullistercoris]|nr:amidohydrolase [Candidatus Mediterraneibacter pullistercoris]
MREEIVKKMKDTADYIFCHPEPSLNEYQSSRALASFLEDEGFKVSWGLAGFETAFLAEWSNGQSDAAAGVKTVVGFLAEYDALPGLGQGCVPEQKQNGEPGHGCGHNLLGTACAGAACELKERMRSEKLPGTIRVYGCPAEEIVVGKIRMNEQGIFDGLSVAVTWHPFDRNRVSYDIWQAQDIKNYKFYGTSAHASKHPEMGRSALDAAELMNVGVNYLREHVTDDVRMHYTYTNTDGPANIVPAYASTNYFIRSNQWERTEDASERVDNCARGAALMTGTRVEIERVTCNKEMKVNRTLAEVFYEEMENIPAPDYTEEEIEFARKISEAAGFDNGGVYFTGLEPLEDEPVSLSIGTDVSDVSHTVPTIMLSAAAMCRGTPLHHWAATAQAGMSIGRKGMNYAAECMAAGAYRLIKDPEIIERAWKEMTP